MLALKAPTRGRRPRLRGAWASARARPSGSNAAPELPDGREVTVAFTWPSRWIRACRAVFFTCQQTAPEHFWKPAYQTHENGATASPRRC